MKELTVLPSPSNYPAYVRAVSQIPLLSEEEEKRLANEWQQEGSIDAAKRLVLSNLGLVLKVVKNHEGYGLPKSDLAQEGTVGLMKAVHKFNPQQGVRLATYAWYWIEAEVKEFILKNWRLVSFGTSSLAKKIFFGYRKTVQSLRGLGEERKIPSDQEIAQSMNISVADAQLAQSYFLGQDGSLQFDDGEDKDMEEYPMSSPYYFQSAQLLEWDDSEQSSPFVRIEMEEAKQRKKHLYHALSSLPSRTQAIIKERLLTDKPKTLSQLSQQYGVSIERVRQLEKQGLQELKTKLLPSP